jgi:hypothetical protein
LNSVYQKKSKDIDSTPKSTNRYLQKYVEDGGEETVTQKDIDLVDAEIIQELKNLLFEDDVLIEEGRQ